MRNQQSTQNASRTRFSDEVKENAFDQLTEAIKSAIELEIFTAVSEGKMTAAAIAARCQSSVRGVRILCDFVTIHNFLTKQGGLTQLPQLHE